MIRRLKALESLLPGSLNSDDKSETMIMDVIQGLIPRENIVPLLTSVPRMLAAYAYIESTDFSAVTTHGSGTLRPNIYTHAITNE